MHSNYAHIQMKYKSSLELGLQTFVILDIHPHKNPTIEHNSQLSSSSIILNYNKSINHNSQLIHNSAAAAL